MLDRLELYIKVRHSLIYIKTNEEFRLINQIETLGNKLSYQVRTWNFDENGDPIKFLDGVKKDDGAFIYILQDLHVFLTKDDGVGIK